MRRFLSVIFVFWFISSVSANPDSLTKFLDAKPHIFTEKNYSKEKAKDKRTYKVPQVEYSSYYVYTKLGKPTELHFPYPIKFKQVDTNFFFISETPDHLSLIIRPQISADLNQKFDKSFIKKQLFENEHFCYVALQLPSGKNISFTIRISVSQKFVNDKIIFYDPATDTDPQINTEAALKRIIEKKDTRILEGLRREQHLHFGNFKSFEVDITKTFKDSLVILKNITISNGFLYFNLIIKGADLLPLTTKDVLLKLEPFSYKWFFEDKGSEHTLKPKDLVIYPTLVSEDIPETNQLITDGTGSLQENQITLTFKLQPEMQDIKQFHTKLYLQGETILFTKKIEIKNYAKTEISFEDCL